MSLVITAFGLPDLLETERTKLNGYFYGLFVNDYVPVVGSTLANLTECSDAGYVATGRQNPSFALAYLNGSNLGQMDSPPLTWTFTHGAGDFVVYGYFIVTLATLGNLVIAERAATPFTVTAAGQTYTVTPLKKMGTM